MGLFNFKNLFRKNNISEGTEKIDLNKPVENPDLKKAFADFSINKTEETLQLVINGLIEANLIVLFFADHIKTTKDEKGNLFFDKGSVIEFINCVDKDKILLPLFTDWQEVDLWIKNRESNIQSFIMPTVESFEWVLNNDAYNGIVINPGSTGWTMNKEQVKNFIMDNNQKTSR
jgi:hypothetical protein